MSNIADLIFDNNSTLFEVLDDLDVPNLALEVKDVSDALNASLEQVRQLGLVVDNNQIANNTKFVDLNTKTDDLEAKIDGIIPVAEDALSRVTVLETFTRENITRLDANVANVNTRLTNEISSVNQVVGANTTNISILQTDVTAISDEVIVNGREIANLESVVAGYELRLRILETSKTSVEAELNSLKTRVTQIEAKFSSIPLSLTELYYSSGYVVPGGIYRVVNQVASNYFQRSLVIDVPNPYASIRMGVVYSGTIDGVRHDNIQFHDNITATTGASFQAQNGMVPVGGPIGWRYRTSASVGYTIGNIRITKQYLK